MSEWRNYLLSEFLDFGNGRTRPKQSGPYPIYGGNGILGFTNKHNCDEETIVIGRVGAYCGSVYFENKKIWVSDNALSAKPKNGYISKFLYYLLGNINLNQYAEGSSHPLITQKLLNSIEVFTTSNSIKQKTIAGVLSSLDDKIDLLHRQNQTLEAMAETLFRQWFIEEAEDDWEAVKLKDYISTNNKTLKKKNSLSHIKYLDTGSLTEGVICALQNLEITKAPSRAKRLVTHNDILISSVRPNQKHYGIIRNPDKEIVVSTGFVVITCEQLNPYFVYYFLTNPEMTEYLHSIAEGSTSTYPSLKPSDIESLEFQLPSAEKLNIFEHICDSFWDKIEYNVNVNS